MESTAIINGGLYNVLFANHPEVPLAAKLLYHASGESMAMPRLRDLIFEQHKDGHMIRMHTRLGGGNRVTHQDEILKLQNHPWYVRDNDCIHDDTYADFYFEVPWSIVGTIIAGIDAPTEQVFKPPLDMGKRFKDMMETMEAGGAESEAIKKNITENIDSDDGAIKMTPLDKGPWDVAATMLSDED